MNYEQKLLELAAAKDNLLILTAENRAAIRNLPNIIPDRFIDFGIMEQTMVGASVGLALRGNVCIAHALAAFLTMRAFEFIRTDIGISNANVKLVGSFAGILSEANGPTHQAIEDISLMRVIPNMRIFAPSDEQDLILGLDKIIEDKSPWYIRYINLPSLIDNRQKFEIGKGELIFNGNDLVIFSYGALFNEAYKAAKKLRTIGLSVMLANIRTLKPIDENLIIEAALNSKLLVVVEDHFSIGGLYSIIAELLAAKRIACNIFQISFQNKWFKPALLEEALKYEKLTGDFIVDRILEFNEHQASKKNNIKFMEANYV